MVRETKVGLLAGLAFIICFAIILANRGRHEPTTTHLPYLVDNGGNVPRVAQTPGSQQAPQQTPSARERTDPVSPHHTDTLTYRSSPVRANRATDDAAPTHLASSGADVLLPSYETQDSQALTPNAAEGTTLERSMSRASVVMPGLDTPTLASLTTATGGPSLTSPPRDRAQQQRILQEHLDSLGERRGDVSQSNRRDQYRPDNGATTHREQPGAVPSPPRATPDSTSRQTRSVRHTVVSGDTLSKIAATHYGSRSATVISAIFDTNRSVLSSPDVLRVGVELTLPVINGFDLRSGGGATYAVRTTSSPSRGGPTAVQTNRSPFQWYQIKKNDRYISIAREQLGSASRWREIYELNKDKFPDPQQIREGVRIKLPVTAVAAARGTRR